jgi:hypothetical protein
MCLGLCLLLLICAGIAAANNYAISLLYTCGLQAAIKFLENLLFRETEKFLNETLVFNLCIMYELATDRSVEKKKEVYKLITRHASEAFNPAVVKLS